MAKSKFDFTNKKPENPQTANTAQTGNQENDSNNKKPQNTPETGNQENNNDAYDPDNDFHVEISDTSSPIVILFGAGNSGKTMTLRRLTQYLKVKGYKVSPQETFRDFRDAHYQKMCREFSQLIHSRKAAGRTKSIDYMLVKVEDKSGKSICQLLEAPGEHYFDPNKPREDFKPYLNTIIASPNRRTWVIIVEINWMNPSNREEFTDKIKELYSGYISPHDRVIITCHKADKILGPQKNTQYNIANFRKLVEDNYKGIFTIFKNNHPFSRFWRESDADFVVFSAGRFTDDGEGGLDYVPSNENNPASLWNAILKTVKGGWFS